MNSAIRTRLGPGLRSSCASPSSVRSSFPNQRTAHNPRFSSSSAPAPSAGPSAKGKRRPSIALRGTAFLVACGAIGGATYDYLTSSGPNSLGPLGFTQLKLTAIDRITHDTAIFTLAVPAGMKVDGMALGGLSAAESVASVWVKQPDLQIQRAYTPLDAASCFTPPTATEAESIELLVKRYGDGELSRWMHGLSVGDEVGVRGPVLTWATPQVCDEVVFVVGGTGVTPAYQFLRSTLAQSTDATAPSPNVTILYSSPSPSNIYLKKELDALAASNPSRVSLRYLVDQEDGALPSQASSSWWPFGSHGASALKAREDGVLVGRAQVKDMHEWIGRGKGEDKAGARRVVIVCGPESMVNAIAGPRARDLSQGPIGGILGELGYGRGEVVKL